MDGRNIEPRTVLWAIAEVSWEDPTGTPYRAPATLEDTSPSGACIRLKSPISIGSRLIVKWKREQFSAIARNCRSDGKDFLLGVRRDQDHIQIKPLSKEIVPAKASVSAPPQLAATAPKDAPPQSTKAQRTPPKQEASQKKSAAPNSECVRAPFVPAPPAPASVLAETPDAPRRLSPATAGARGSNFQKVTARRTDPPRRAQSQPVGASPRRERKVMQAKGFFPHFWRKQDAAGAPDQTIPTEVTMNQSNSHPAEGLTGPQSDLLSYEDIYRAAGILSPDSGYGIHKVVDMLNSDRIRNLSPEIKRASVLMALDASGTSTEDLLRDATRRQQALGSYDAGQQKQLEEFEARKTQENSQIQAEMERVTAHYAERIQHNHDQVARERETLRNWQMQKQYESHRISEVIELCAKQPAAAPLSNAAAASSSSPVHVDPAGNLPPRTASSNAK
jgi:hypothetical protein